MTARWVEWITGSFEEKRRYRQYKTRVANLPASYRTAAEAFERYLNYSGGITDGDVMLKMFGDLADLFEQSAADETPIRDLFGDDPVEFAEAFLDNYSEGRWLDKERERFVATINQAAGAI